MENLDNVLAGLEIKYGPITFCDVASQGCAHFLYDDDCSWGCKGNAMGA